MDDDGGAKAAQVLVVGAGGGIGGAVVEHWAADPDVDRVWALSRTPRGGDPGGKVIGLAAEHDEAAIAASAERIVGSSPRLRRVVIALGTLHGEHYAPEKSLDALQAASMLEVYRINCVLPLLWVAALGRQLRRAEDCRIAVLSARVGSIGDNRLGGWYSYRCAKAALNMGLKTAAIELARRARGVKLVAFHPGTVATPLSAPFSGNVPDGQLLEPAFVAGRLAALLDAHAPDGELSYIDWAGKVVAW